MILFKPDFTKISDFLQNPVDLDFFNPNCEVIQNYLNDFTFLFSKERPLIFFDNFEELPLEFIPIPDIIELIYVTRASISSFSFKIFVKKVLKNKIL